MNVSTAISGPPSRYQLAGRSLALGALCLVPGIALALALQALQLAELVLGLALLEPLLRLGPTGFGGLLPRQDAGPVGLGPLLRGVRSRLLRRRQCDLPVGLRLPLQGMCLLLLRPNLLPLGLADLLLAAQVLGLLPLQLGVGLKVPRTGTALGIL